MCRFLAGWPRRAARLLFVSAAAMTMVAAMLASAAGAAYHQHERPVFQPPVDAPVADPFRSPEDPYGPGNRGVEYDTVPGQVVRAAAAGRVAFAGPVARSLYITLDHGGGLVSSYSYLQRISVRAGARVARGAVIGIAGERLHFGVRLEGAYTDPDSFIGVRRVRVRLVPLRGRAVRPRLMRSRRRKRACTAVAVCYWPSYTAALAPRGSTASNGVAESFRNPRLHPVV